MAMLVNKGGNKAMEIRHINENDDRLAVSRVYEESWKYAYRSIIPRAYLDNIPEGRWAASIDDPDRNTLLMLDGREIIGTSCYCRSRYQEWQDYGEIVSIYLLPQYTGKGLGSRLFLAAVSELIKLGFNDIFLWVLEENENARLFYEHMGFRADGHFLDDDIGGRKLREIRYVFHAG